MKPVKFFLLVLIIIFPAQKVRSQQDTICIVSWNVENLFDTVNDKGKEDEEFTPAGSKKWNARKLQTKLRNLAKVIKYMNHHKAPDILGLVEVEHKYLVDSLFNEYFPERNYNVVSYESPDTRGIQNALVYDADKFSLISSNAVTVPFYDQYTTRDILHVSLKINSEIIDLFVNHWPSRRGGVMQSRPRRINAASVLKNYIKNTEPENIIIMGDFNDEPDNVSIAEILNAKNISTAEPDFSDDVNSLFNLAYPLFLRGKGTILFRDEYNMLDQILISEKLLDKKGIDYLTGTFEILQPIFIITSIKEKVITIPTFQGSSYSGGFSDHFPVSAKFVLIK